MVSHIILLHNYFFQFPPRGENISTGVEIFPPGCKYFHQNMELLNLWKYFHPGINISTLVEIFLPRLKYSHRGGN